MVIAEERFRFVGDDDCKWRVMGECARCITGIMMHIMLG